MCVECHVCYGENDIDWVDSKDRPICEECMNEYISSGLSSRGFEYVGDKVSVCDCIIGGYPTIYESVEYIRKSDKGSYCLSDYDFKYCPDCGELNVGGK